MTEDLRARIESEIEVKSYIQDLKYALKNGAIRNDRRCFHGHEDH